MPMSCKCILDRMVHKGAMTEKERDKILRNLKSNELTWRDFDDAAKYMKIEDIIEKAYSEFLVLAKDDTRTITALSAFLEVLKNRIKKEILGDDQD
ncbi:MAG: hypothetical protein J6U54_16100 [Clostridiales bacterium]|nr:hypothetical protein [Clostridiales bacterium]